MSKPSDAPSASLRHRSTASASLLLKINRLFVSTTSCLLLGSPQNVKILFTLPWLSVRLRFGSSCSFLTDLLSVAARLYSSNCSKTQWSEYRKRYTFEYFWLFLDQCDILLYFADLCLQGFYLFIVVFNLHEIFLLFLCTFLFGFRQFLDFILSSLQSFIEPSHFLFK